MCDKLEDQNWIDPYDLQNLLNLNNFEIISKKTEILFPLDNFLSKFLKLYLENIFTKIYNYYFKQILKTLNLFFKNLIIFLNKCI